MTAEPVHQILEPQSVALRHPGVCEEVMSERDRLRLAVGPKPVAFVVYALDESGGIMRDAWIQSLDDRLNAGADGGIRLPVMPGPPSILRIR